MTNSMHNISADISINGQKLEDVTSFKYLGATLCKDGTCAAEVRISHQDCLTNGSNGQIKQDLALPHPQVCK